MVSYIFFSSSVLYKEFLSLQNCINCIICIIKCLHSVSLKTTFFFWFLAQHGATWHISSFRTVKKDPNNPNEWITENDIHTAILGRYFLKIYFCKHQSHQCNFEYFEYLIYRWPKCQNSKYNCGHYSSFSSLVHQGTSGDS